MEPIKANVITDLCKLKNWYIYSESQMLNFKANTGKLGTPTSFKYSKLSDFKSRKNHREYNTPRNVHSYLLSPSEMNSQNRNPNMQGLSFSFIFFIHS
jgi:hypothetical protein